MVHGHLDGMGRLVLIHLQGSALGGTAVELGEDPAVPDAPLGVLGLESPRTGAVESFGWGEHRPVENCELRRT